MSTIDPPAPEPAVVADLSTRKDDEPSGGIVRSPPGGGEGSASANVVVPTATIPVKGAVGAAAESLEYWYFCGDGASTR